MTFTNYDTHINIIVTQIKYIRPYSVWYNNSGITQNVYIQIFVIFPSE